MGKKIISTGAKESTFSVGSDTNNYYQSTKQVAESKSAAAVDEGKQQKVQHYQNQAAKEDNAPAPKDKPAPMMEKKSTGYNIITNQPTDDKAERCGKGFFALKQKELHDNKKYNIITNADLPEKQAQQPAQDE